VVNGDDDDVLDWPGDGQRILFGRRANSAPCVTIEDHGLSIRFGDQQEFLHWEEVSEELRLPHLRGDVAAALGAMLAVESSLTSTLSLATVLEEITPALREFRMLPHRLQRVAERQGRTFWND